MTSMELCALHGIGACTGAEMVLGERTDETGNSCFAVESTAGNNTSETTCQGEIRTYCLLILMLNTITTVP